MHKTRLILDADTANEIDDLYAIVRTLEQEEFEVLGISSAQWFHYLSGDRTVYASQQINEDLLRLLGRQELPAPIGADEAFGKPWGGTEPKDSPAAQFIIQQARATPDNERLLVVCLGATTNLASAIRLAPDIAPRINVYLMGFRYDLEQEVWNKSEFNIRRDLNAADFLLDQDDLELHVMPATVAWRLSFQREDTFLRQEAMGDLGHYLTKRWKKHAPEQDTWIMWDLALVEALIKPDLATEREVLTPPENLQRKVWLYDSIDVDGMRTDYWRAVASLAGSAKST